MRRQHFLYPLILVVLPAAAAAGPQSFTEDFTSSEFIEVSQSTACLDTVAGQLVLCPFSPTLTGSIGTSQPTFDVAIQGNFAYLATGTTGLQVVDITYPASPLHVGSYNTPDLAYGVWVQGNRAYVADSGSGLVILDISNPANPTLLGVSNHPEDINDVVVRGTLAYLAAGDGGLYIVDVSSPAAPALLGSWSNGTSYALRLAVEGRVAYLAGAYGGLVLVDISNPASPSFLGSVVTTGDAEDVAVDGCQAYVAAGPQGLVVVDASNPSVPTVLGTYDTPDWAVGVEVSSDLVLVADRLTGLIALDTQDPSLIRYLWEYNSPGLARNVRLFGEHAYLADEGSGLQIVQSRNYGSFDWLSTEYLPSIPSRLAVQGNTAFIAAGALLAVDITDPENTSLIANFSPGSGPITGVDVEGKLAVVAEDDSVMVLDVSQPATPTVLGGVSVSQPACVVMQGGRAYAVGNTGLSVIDISNPSAPATVAFVSGPATALDVCGNRLVVGTQSSLKLYDVTTATPAVLATSSSYPVEDLKLQDGTAHVVDSDGLYTLYDISGGSFVWLNNAGGATVSGNYRIDVEGDRAVVFGGDFLIIFNLSQPAFPSFGGYYEFGIQGGIALHGNYLAVAAAEGTYLGMVRILDAEYDAPALGWSRPILQNFAPIVRTRVTSTVSGFAQWSLTSNGGFCPIPLTCPESIPGEWKRSAPGWSQYELRWNVHLFRGTSLPAISDVTIEWLHEAPVINSIADVPNDQGGWARVAFTRSGYDFSDEALRPLLGYNVHRRMDGAAAVRVLTEGKALDSTAEIVRSDGERIIAFPVPGEPALLTHEGRLYRNVAGSATAPPGLWEVVASVYPQNAEYTDAVLNDYTVLVPTLQDSSLSGSPTVYYVTAHAFGKVYASAPDSGYSVDNIAPGVPQSLSKAVQASANVMDWDDNTELDFQFYRIYRSTDPGFTPGPASLVHETATSAWTDAISQPWLYTYKVTALDHAGNESAPASEGVVTGTQEPALVFALLGASPNPFQGSTAIRFTTPEEDAPVTLEIFDAQGRRVRTLARGLFPAGDHELRWNGQTDAGLQGAGGVYFVRLSSSQETRTLRVVQLRH